MSIARKSVKDAEDITRLAVEAAKREIIDVMARALQRIVDGKLRSGKLAEDIDRLNRARDGHGETEFEEGKDMPKQEDDLDMESLSGMFPSISEVADEEEVAEAAVEVE